MKLSEALRLGSMQVPAMTPKAKIFEVDDQGCICSACALGTIAVAVGITEERWYAGAIFGRGDLVDAFPLLAMRVDNPARAWLVDRTLAFQISALFESYGWTRERIASWLETIEAQHEQAAEAVHATA